MSTDPRLTDEDSRIPSFSQMLKQANLGSHSISGSTETTKLDGSKQTIEIADFLKEFSKLSSLIDELSSEQRKLKKMVGYQGVTLIILTVTLFVSVVTSIHISDQLSKWINWLETLSPL